MKKAFFVLIPIIFIVIGCAGGAKSGSGGMTLDQAIKEAAIEIDREIAAGTKIALLNFTSPAEGFSSYVLDELTANLVGTKKLTVVDRKEMDLIRSESNFQLSGEVSDDSMQAIGQKLGAQSIVSGSLQDIGGSYRIVIRVLNVESAAVVVQYRNDIANDSRVKALLAGGKSGGTATAGGGATQTASGGTATVQYKIGDIGPAGGLIFYDKGNSTGGWRYLEAAPEETEANVNWVPEAMVSVITYNDQLRSDVGSGKTNSRDLMDVARRNGGGFGWAVQICDELSINGFDDWFLPSSDELNFMYGNLHRKGLGGFRSDWYWSSSWYRPNNGRIKTINFTDGRLDDGSHGVSFPARIHRVRAIRQF